MDGDGLGAISPSDRNPGRLRYLATAPAGKGVAPQLAVVCDCVERARAVEGCVSDELAAIIGVLQEASPVRRTSPDPLPHPQAVVTCERCRCQIPPVRRNREANDRSIQWAKPCCNCTRGILEDVDKKRAP